MNCMTGLHEAGPNTGRRNGACQSRQTPFRRITPMDLSVKLRTRVARSCSDPELAAHARGLEAKVMLIVGAETVSLRFSGEGITLSDSEDAAPSPSRRRRRIGSRS